MNFPVVPGVGSRLNREISQLFCCGNAGSFGALFCLLLLWGLYRSLWLLPGRHGNREIPSSFQKWKSRRPWRMIL